MESEERRGAEMRIEEGVLSRLDFTVRIIDEWIEEKDAASEETVWNKRGLGWARPPYRLSRGSRQY